MVAIMENEKGLCDTSSVMAFHDAISVAALAMRLLTSDSAKANFGARRDQISIKPCMRSCCRC
jgi:hypothetical protein